jgi:hypothetical protein
LELLTASRASSDLYDLFAHQKRMNDARALAPLDAYWGIALGANFCPCRQGCAASRAVTWDQGIAAWALVGTRCEFKTAERAIKE